MAPVKSGNSWKNLLLLSSGNERLLDEEDIDFGSDVYALAESSTDELLSSWKVFTALKDESYDGRRLENAAWRLHAMQKLGKTPSFQAASQVTQGRCAFNKQAPISVQLDDAHLSHTHADLGKAVADSDGPHPMLDDSWAAKHLLGVCLKNKLSNDAIEEVLQVIQHVDFRPSDLPSTPEQLRALPHNQRPVCAIFTHSLERNGANNFCLYIARLLRHNQPLTIFSPKKGPMQEDFEKLGLEVTIMDTTSPKFLEDLSSALLKRRVGLLLANTIMRCDIILMAAELQMPSVWVIHESWPQDQLDHYAKEVFMCKDIDAAVIRKAFAAAGTIVFPSDMQRDLYNGMFKPQAGLTIYNGIPLQQLDAFKHTQDRRQVRAALGYTNQDFLVLHLGTVCSRKGQVFSAKACAKLITENKCTNLKQLIVGARYIREHEIKYIDQIFDVAASYGLSCRRWEELSEDEAGKPDITIMDIQAAVLRFYMAADVVLVPSLNEVLPLVICESMAFERPVVCSNIDAIPEALSDGVEGFLVPPGNADAIRDAVLRLYQSPELRKQMGAAGRARVLKQFSYEHMGECYRELLDTVPAPEQKLQGEVLKGKTVLVDMDNTIVDWDGEFIRRYSEASGQDPLVVEKLVRNREKFEIEENFQASERAQVMEVIASPGFYESLEPLPGAVEALHKMVDEGVDVKLACTAREFLVMAGHSHSGRGDAWNEAFWDLHRRLGECYAQDLLMMQEGRMPAPPLPRAPSKETPPSLWAESVKMAPSAPSPATPCNGRVPSQPLFPLPRAASKPLVPVDDMGLMLMDSPDLWQSEAFLEDLQVLQKKHDRDIVQSNRSPTEKSKNSMPSEEFDSEHVFCPRAFWSKPIDGSEEVGRQSKSICAFTSKSRRVLSTGGIAPELLRARRTSSQCFYMLRNPSSTFSTWWGTIGVLLLSYDFVVIPLRFVGLGESSLLTIMFWIAHLYWNAAIPLSFITGYDEDGLLVLNLRKTCRNYGTTWFILDLALVSLDWTILVLDSDGDSAGVARLSRTIRSLRFLRLLRLGRVVRLGSIIESVKEQLSSRMANIQYSIMKIIFQLLIYNHIIACLWYGIGAEDHDDSSWVQRMQLNERSVSVRYATSLHWAYSQLGVGSTEIEAINLNERVFSIVVSFMALLSFSTVISSMTSLLAALQKLKNDEMEQFSGLRKFLLHNNIDPDLSIRVTRFLKHTFAMKHKALSKDGKVAILDMLSKSLHEELEVQRHNECLQDSGFLHQLLLDPGTDAYQVLCSVVTTCLQHGVFALDDVVFAHGTVSAACYYISDGRCRYDHSTLKSAHLARLSNVWIAEMCLWTPWLHMGNLEAQDISRLISIEVATFCDAVDKNQRIRRMASDYAVEFVRDLNILKHWSDLNPAILKEEDQRSIGFPQSSSIHARKCCSGKGLFSKVLPSG